VKLVSPILGLGIHILMSKHC